MLVPEEIVLGLLLAVSSFLLFLSVVSYRRSGVRALLVTVIGLAVHIGITVSVLVMLSETDWLDRVDSFLLVAGDAIILILVLVAGLAGGRVSERPS
jgi:hypothetical protein